MKLFIFLFLLPSLLLADTYVRGYYKKSGTYVKPHYRSTRDSSHNNNWSTKYNVNPYTGSIGTKPRRYESNIYGTKKKRTRKKRNIYGY